LFCIVQIDQSIDPSCTAAAAAAFFLIDGTLGVFISRAAGWQSGGFHFINTASQWSSFLAHTTHTHSTHTYHTGLPLGVGRQAGRQWWPCGAAVQEQSAAAELPGAEDSWRQEDVVDEVRMALLLLPASPPQLT
jgi:hypothetical protein